MNKQAERERRARAEQVRVEAARRERRRTALVVAASLSVIVVLVSAVAVVIQRELADRDAREAAASAPIDGVNEFEDLSQNHVETAVNYPQNPPVGGEHAPVWTNCGIYTQPVSNEQSVHSLEHGAVWVTYQSDLPAEQVKAITDATANRPYALVSPFEGSSSPVVASAWGVQLELDDASDPRLVTFLDRYLEGEQTPEPGATCAGGVGTP